MKNFNIKNKDNKISKGRWNSLRNLDIIKKIVNLFATKSFEVATCSNYFFLFGLFFSAQFIQVAYY